MNFEQNTYIYFQLLNLLKLIIGEQNNGTKAYPFDPKAAIFIANRFDAVPQDSKRVVKEHIIAQLSASWPQYDPSMTVFFSTKLALRDVSAHPDYINDNYRELLHAFSKLYFYVMDRRLRTAYKFVYQISVIHEHPLSLLKTF